MVCCLGFFPSDMWRGRKGKGEIFKNWQNISVGCFATEPLFFLCKVTRFVLGRENDLKNFVLIGPEWNPTLQYFPL